jgi:hypothetical protein
MNASITEPIIARRKTIPSSMPYMIKYRKEYTMENALPKRRGEFMSSLIQQIKQHFKSTMSNFWSGV